MGALSDEVFAALAEERFSGRTERELVWWVERSFREAGAEGVSFPTVVAAGETGTSPHAVPGDEPIEPGVLVTIDAGCVVDGYCSDCTRTFAVGAVPSGSPSSTRSASEAQLAGLAAVGPGVHGRDADAASRSLIDAAGLGAAFGHGSGTAWVSRSTRPGPPARVDGRPRARERRLGRAGDLRPRRGRGADRGPRPRHRRRPRAADAVLEGARDSRVTAAMAETVSTNQFRNGMHIEVDGDVWRIVEFQHVKPGKGGAFVGRS